MHGGRSVNDDDADSTIPGGDEVSTVEDQFGDTQSIVMWIPHS